MSRIFNSLLPLLMILLLAGCAQQGEGPDLMNLDDARFDAGRNGNLHLTKEYRVPNENGKGFHRQYAYEKIPGFEEEGGNRISIRNRAKPEISVSGDKVKISVESIPINQFIDLAFGKVFKLNYSVDPSVKKMTTPITLNMQKPEKASQVYEVVKKILAFHGVGLSEKGGVVFIRKIKKKGAPQRVDEMYISYGRSLPSYIRDDQDVMLFVPYYYINPHQTVNILRQAGISDVKFYYYIDGIQTMVGRAEEIRKALRLVDMLDRPFLQGLTSYLVNLDNIDVNYFTKKLKKIMALNGINVVDSPSKGGIVLYPIRELNAVYVITPKKSWLKMVLYWKKRLDRLSDIKDEPRVYVYHVRYRKADDLAKAVNQILGLSVTHRTSAVFKSSQAGGKSVQASKEIDLPNAPLIEAVNYTPTVTADLETNTLIFKLTPQHYKKLLPYLRQLDKLPLQTLVEVTVAEVSLTDTFKLGFEYAIRNYDLGLSKDMLNINVGGGGLGIIFRGNNIDATIDAFAKKELLNIISRPKILILNNQTGKINVGTQVPVITSETSAPDLGGGGNGQPTINRNITYRTTGITLGMTPTINSNGVVTMNISIDLSEAQINDTSKIDSPMIINRTLNTAAVIRSGDTILIGGLISQNRSKGKSGVPGLMNIPLLGDLFTSKSDKVSKTELIMLIRPTIITSSRQMREATWRYKTLLRQLNALF